MKLSRLVVCECGFATMDSGAVALHICDERPEEWAEEKKSQKSWTEDDARALAFHGEDD